jgi:D-amino-acid dehydrogenase
MTHLAVLGAGITGITTAYHLHEVGHDVTVIDRHRYAAMETSFANGGQLSASNAEVWTTWATVLKGMKWMLRRDAPLLVHPAPCWHKVSWMAEFLGNVGNYRANTRETVRLALAARPLLREMAARAGVDYDRSDAGILHFYETARELEQARRVTRIYAEAGLDRHELGPEEVADLEPRLATRPAGGFWTPSDSTGDIHRFTVGVARWLERRGVAFDLGHEVRDLRTLERGVEIEGARYDGVVVCAGVGSRAVAARLGDRVNVYPVKGYSITVNLDDARSRGAAPRVSLLDDRAKIVTSRLGTGRLRVAGTAEFGGFDRDIRAGRIRPLTAWVERHFPDVSTESVVPWAGLRPMTPSMMPKVGRGRHEAVFYNTGHGHLGWTLSAATAQAVAGVVTAAMPPSARIVRLAA